MVNILAKNVVTYKKCFYIKLKTIEGIRNLHFLQ